ncbi:hypothetical protein [Gimesia sp.]|uniref:hypothetical protein n=1 Tax=Gimesia sp. TaxID=2024833 RepID=UPI003A91D4EB
MGRCLLKEELSEFISEVSSGNLKADSWASRSSSWELEIVGLNYILIQILLSMGHDTTARNQVIVDYFNLICSSSCWFTEEEFNSQFIGLLLSQIRDRSQTLEEEIVELREKISDHKYDRAIR